jgi:uncharacterized membrane protein
MKKIFTLSAICIIGSILFSACKSNTSITKRHYRDGYYITHNKGKQAATNNEEEKNVRKNTKKQVYNPLPGVNQNQNPAYEVENKFAIINTNVVASKEKTKTKIISKQPVSYKTKIIETLAAHISNKSPLQKIAVADSDRDGLSLFWIIILIILILWAVGFLAGGFGLGGLIHLLLVIALVLLILWLLRII